MNLYNQMNSTKEQEQEQEQVNDVVSRMLERIAHDNQIKRETTEKRIIHVVISMDEHTTSLHDKFFLQCKRQLKSDFESTYAGHYMDDIELSHQIVHYLDDFYLKHQWDALGMISSCGILIPFLLPQLIYDRFTWATQPDGHTLRLSCTIRPSAIVCH